ncbi:MAG: lycopene cyclase domain-containing protein [Candidatus Kapabacteria bacterium]|jgi:lycopene cyclase domain-containing protein|nr:lycopene cyclase domain-containing protein [Candidatus Kapabacteria bacterium]
MTYRGFHLRINAPIILLLGCILLAVGSPYAEFASVAIPLAVLLAIVVVFTAPWDNRAIEWGIWDFPDDRLLFRIRRLPIEELAFFVLQTIEVVIAVLIALSVFNIRLQPADVTASNLTLCGAIAVMWGGGLLLGRNVPRNHPRWHYAWHLAIWFLPLIAMQWALAPDVLRAGLPCIITSALVVGTALSIADVWAVRHGIWFFDSRRNTGHLLGQILPWEEVAFFYITSVVVAQSILLLLPPR